MEESNGVKSFTFYEDYFYLIDTMPIEDKKELAVAILDYVFKNKIPNLIGHNQAIFNTLSHQLSKSINKSTNARKNKSIQNQMKINSKSNENQIKIKQGNKTSVLSFKFYISSFKFINNNNLIINKLEEWFKYKTERKEYYKETGLKTLLKRIDNNIEKYGNDVILDLIDECMANNYKGIIFDKLQKQTLNKVNEPSWLNKNFEEERKELSEENRKIIESIKNGN